ncbi:hypothetical protein BSKO_11353 [Bryopsis sp. KO-2023]|nr:hypothetical protein BSKO_11353 [Bryopsis sp. KO-2023]
MASILTANLPSDDEGDEDYDPGRADKLKEKGQKRALEESVEIQPPNPVKNEPSPEQIAKKAKVDAIWMKLNEKSNVRKSKGIGAVPGLGREEKSTKADPDRFWKSMLSTKSSSKSGAKELSGKDGSIISIAKSALAAVKEARSITAAQMHGKVLVTETKKLGGQSVEVKKVVAEGSAEAEKASRPTATAGFDAFLESIDGKKKVNVLDKSRSDWQDHKKTDTGLEEELEVHKRSNDQYLDKVDFLERSTAKQYEKERDNRLASDMRTRGRL